MKIEPCVYCVDKDGKNPPMLIQASAHDREYKLHCVECSNCGARSILKASQDEAVIRWNEISVVVREGKLAQKELEAYRALSGGKTAIDYALWTKEQTFKNIAAFRETLLNIRSMIGNIPSSDLVSIIDITLSYNNIPE